MQIKHHQTCNEGKEKKYYKQNLKKLMLQVILLVDFSLWLYKHAHVSDGSEVCGSSRGNGGWFTWIQNRLLCICSPFK